MARLLPDRLQTGRLLLRQPCVDDARPLFDVLTQDIEVARYTVWRPHAALNETEAFVAQCIDAWSRGVRQPYVLALSSRPDQAIGILEARRISQTVDIGYVLARRHWGGGLMPEAILALTDAALSLPAIFRVQATCDVENHASARTLEKAGFVREGRLSRYTLHPNLSAEPRACFMYARCR